MLGTAPGFISPSRNDKIRSQAFPLNIKSHVEEVWRHRYLCRTVQTAMAALETFQKQLGVQGFYTPENAQLDPQNIYTIDPKGSRIVGTLPIIFRLFAVQLHGGYEFWDASHYR